MSVKLAQALAQAQRGGHQLHVGQVKSADWTQTPPVLAVAFSGSSVATPNVRFLGWYMPQVGDMVIALHTGPPRAPGGGDWLVLGTVAAGPRPIFSGYASASQSLPAATFSTILVNTVQIDTANMLNPSNGTWSIPLAGVYRVSGIAEVGTPADAFAVVNHSNVQAARGNRTAGQAVTTVSVVTALVVCAAGDYLNLQAYTSAANTTAIGGSGQTNRLDIEFFSPA